MLLMIDNYDSFTYNLVHYFAEIGCTPTVYRNDQITLKTIEQLAPEKIIISPGPCSPNESGISLEVIEHFKGQIPILGVCLGHQAICQAFGGKIIRAKQVMHGKTSQIFHKNQSIFRDLPSPFTATRYHSLTIDPQSLPDCFDITAWTNNNIGEFDEIMAIQHKQYPISGVQFHPESILTDFGHELLKNFLSTTKTSTIQFACDCKE